jgi:hypothetical protein
MTDQPQNSSWPQPAMNYTKLPNESLGLSQNTQHIYAKWVTDSQKLHLASARNYVSTLYAKPVTESLELYLVSARTLSTLPMQNLLLSL